MSVFELRKSIIIKLSHVIKITFYVYIFSGNNGYQVFVPERNSIRSGDEGLRTFGRSGLQ